MATESGVLLQPIHQMTARGKGCPKWYGISDASKIHKNSTKPQSRSYKSRTTASFIQITDHRIVHRNHGPPPRSYKSQITASFHSEMRNRRTFVIRATIIDLSRCDCLHILPCFRRKKSHVIPLFTPSTIGNAYFLIRSIK